MSKKDLRGQRFGKLVCLEPTDQRSPRGGVIWRCRCDCGREYLALCNDLTRGGVKSCGCLRGGAKNDLTGRRFGKLVCLEPTDQRGPSGGVVWRCRCDCGKECLAVSTQLTNGMKKSCGCLEHPPLKSLIGQRFGSLVVIGYDGKRNGAHHWRCRCDCGGEMVTTQSNLLGGHTKSCGCLQRQMYRENLRLVEGTSVTMIENRLQKQTPIQSNASGYNGVYRKKNGRWAAQITFKRHTYYLGTYDKLEDAVKARRRGEEMYDDFLTWYYNEYLISQSG